MGSGARSRGTASFAGNCSAGFRPATWVIRQFARGDFGGAGRRESGISENAVLLAVPVLKRLREEAAGLIE
jgi:hypothetical protein